MAGEKGQAMVEMAAVMPILLVVLFAVLFFLWLLNLQGHVQAAAWQGARYAAPGKTVGEVRLFVQDYLCAAGLQANCPGQQSNGGFRLDRDVQVTYPAADKVQVSVAYADPLLGGELGQVFGRLAGLQTGTLQLSGVAVFRREQ